MMEIVCWCSTAQNSASAISAFSMFPVWAASLSRSPHDRLHSLNPAYDDIFPYEDGAKIIGRVLGKVTEEMIPDQDEQALYMEAQENGLQL